MQRVSCERHSLHSAKALQIGFGGSRVSAEIQAFKDRALRQIGNFCRISLGGVNKSLFGS